MALLDREVVWCDLITLRRLHNRWRTLIVFVIVIWILVLMSKLIMGRFPYVDFAVGRVILIHGALADAFDLRDVDFANASAFETISWLLLTTIAATARAFVKPIHSRKAP